MKVAIQNETGDFGRRWVKYCEQNGIDYKLVDCYKSDILEQLKDCSGFLWQIHQNNPTDRFMAKNLLYALENTNLNVFPNPKTVWHFDDKVGQKYLLESVDAPLVKSWVFYDKKSALDWLAKCTYPKVFKLRGGAGALNVLLVRNQKQGKRLVKRAFGRGFSVYNRWRSLQDRWLHFRRGKKGFDQVLVGLGRLFVPPPYARKVAREKGYIYFQEFIPDNTHDIRVTYVFDKFFASRRFVRPGDFRASGSGVSDMDQNNIPREAFEIAVDVSRKLGLQTAAYDFVVNNGRPEIIEVSYAFGYPEEVFELGYWDSDINFHPGSFNPFGWMVDAICAKEQYV
ncbi:MAG: hypothetical protein N4A74_04735 [Carboxylicivirga sp.]|jgi:glutathione synthase/RimK-type ligase-like ATP-grasp enzyme|nr:hypothetical protein [Carboxylicivirga sp.]